MIKQIQQQVDEKEINTQLNQLEEFLSQNNNLQKIVFITSGGTSVPLEQNTVRSIENFSSGLRGAASAEYFLQHGYTVIYYHRDKCFKPYSRHLNSELLLNSDINEIEKLKKLSQIDKSKLFCIQYITVMEYLYFVIKVVELFNKLNLKVILYLASAVSDYYIPKENMQQHKIQAQETLELKLDPVPKILGLIGEIYPNGIVISFKLETDNNILKKKITESMIKYKLNYCIGNLLQTRRDEVIIYNKGEFIKIDKIGNEIEEQIIEYIVNNIK